MSDTDLFNKLKTDFLQWYESQKEIAYYFTAKDAGSLKQLIKKIEFVGKSKHEGEGKEWVVDAFKWILEHLDEWTQKNVSLALINSRFNEILSYGKQPKVSDEIRRKFLENYNVYKTAGNNPI